ncbi:hypothetical protein OG573_30810 [Streptomyces sp. NBC_01205]|nr:hypothetical protein OG573_30810 [Streptomyces sp. NBC_01205]
MWKDSSRADGQAAGAPTAARDLAAELMHSALRFTRERLRALDI